jgi:hypothetical protein
MKTIILIFTLLLAGTMISNHKKTAQNGKAEKTESESSPRILFLVSSQKGNASIPASLWWSHKQTESGKPGC